MEKNTIAIEEMNSSDSLKVVSLNLTMKGIISIQNNFCQQMTKQ